jgi:hypothetical protein
MATAQRPKLLAKGRTEMNIHDGTLSVFIDHDETHRLLGQLITDLRRDGYDMEEGDITEELLKLQSHIDALQAIITRLGRPRLDGKCYGCDRRLTIPPGSDGKDCLYCGSENTREFFI